MHTRAQQALGRPLAASYWLLVVVVVARHDALMWPRAACCAHHFRAAHTLPSVYYALRGSSARPASSNLHRLLLSPESFQAVLNVLGHPADRAEVCTRLGLSVRLAVSCRDGLAPAHGGTLKR